MSKKNKKSFWDIIISSGVLGLIVSVAIVLMQLTHSDRIEELNRDNSQYLQDLQLEHDKHLKDLQLAHEERLQKRQKEFAIELSKLQSSLDLKRELAAIEKRIKGNVALVDTQLRADIEKNRKQIDFNNQDNINKQRLKYVTQQLSEFYWPVLYRLQKNNSVYKMLGNSFVGERIDKEVILPNHLQVLDILEKKIYLAQPNDEMMRNINKYIEHVNWYQMLRKSGYNGFPESYNGQGYNSDFYNSIRIRTEYLQKEYEKLLTLNKLTDQSVERSLAGLKGNVILTSVMPDMNSKLNDQNEPFNSIKLNVNSYEIKLSHNNKSFYVPVSKDSTFTIAFKNYIPESNFCIIQIGDYKKVKVDKGRNYHVRKGEPFNYELHKSNNYQIILEEVWTERGMFKKPRVKASIKIQSWKKRTSSKTASK